MKNPVNLIDNIPLPDDDEFFEALLETPSIKLERVVSQGHVTPPGEWYDQEHAEWLLLLSGAASLKLEGEDTPLGLKAGDHLLLPAHRRHRVEWTDPDQPTIWLTLKFEDVRPPD